MKNYLKILLIVLIIFIVLILIDIISIYNNFKPIFAIKEDNYVYKGLFYDTYVCPENTVPVIKTKGNKYSCSLQIEFYEIVDKTKKMKDFACAQALELFYEDNENYYYFPCIMSEYIVVKYSNGEVKNIKESLTKGEISIDKLNSYGINFITKSKKIETE